MYNLIDNIIDKNFNDLMQSDLCTIIKHAKLFCKPDNVIRFETECSSFVGSLFDPETSFTEIFDKYFEHTIFERNINKLEIRDNNYLSPKAMLLDALKELSILQLFVVIENLWQNHLVHNKVIFCEAINYSICRSLGLRCDYNIFGVSEANKYLYEQLRIDYSCIEKETLINIIVDSINCAVYPLAKAIRSVADLELNKRQFSSRLTKEISAYKERIDAMIS